MKFIKKVILIIGLALCAYITIINLIYTATVSDSWKEQVTFSHLGIINYIVIGFIIMGIVLFTNFIKEKISPKLDDKKRKIIYLIIFLIYIAISVIWVFLRNSYPIADSLRVYEASSQMYEGRTIENLKYFELYPQNLVLAYMFSKIFKILHTSNVLIIKFVNIVANCFTIVALYKILNLLGEKYKTNKCLLGVIAFTYVPLILLTNFTYGDMISMSFTMFSIYFSMKYVKDNNFYNLIISAFLMMISIILRMNNLIFVIAITIYLILNIKFDKNLLKQNLIKIFLIILFVSISIFPFNILRQILSNRYSLDKENSFPITGFLAMGMEEGERANGWYKEETAMMGWNDGKNSKEKYKQIISERIGYFCRNIGYTIKFYAKKTASMWAEPLQEAIWQNYSFNFEESFLNNLTEEKRLEYEKFDETLKKQEPIVSIYQKALIIIIFFSITIFIIVNRENISNEILLLLLCFMGGFFFHMLWEAKSRYIISYIIVLIPIASLRLKQKSNN